MKDWKKYITEVKNVHSKEDLITNLRASRGLNSDNPNQDSSQTEEEDTLDYEKKELEYVNTELAKQTHKSNKKVKSLKKKLKKLKGKVSDLEDEKDELESQLDQQGSEDETEETSEDNSGEEAPEGEEGESSNEEQGGEEGEVEDKEGEESEESEESEEEEKGLNYDDDLDSVVDLGGKKKRNESLERLINGPMNILMEAIENGAKFEDNYIWWDKYPCYFAYVVSPEQKGVVVLKGSHDLHVVGSGFTKKELEDCMKCLADNLPSNVKEISSHGGISPGGINVLLRLKDYGWTLTGTETGDDHYWCAEIDEEKFVSWISKAENEDYWEETGETTGDFLKDTRPKVPVMKRG